MSEENKQDEWDALSVGERNSKIMASIDGSTEGHVKGASAAGTNMIRRRIREQGFARKIIPQVSVGNSRLSRVIDHDRPVIIEDMEPNSKGAVSIPFSASADASQFYGDKFECVFHEITTPEFTKDVNELRTYEMDLRQVVTDNSLKDVQTTEDGYLLSLVDEIVGATDGVGLSGVKQNFTVAAQISRTNYVDVLSVLEDQNLNNGVFLCNRKTAKAFLKFKRDEIGGDLSQALFEDGLSALSSSTVMGIKHIFTIKRDLVPDGVIYMFTSPNFLGRHYSLQNLTQFVEKKKNIISFSARETISMTIANLAGVAKVTFQMPTALT